MGKTLFLGALVALIVVTFIASALGFLTASLFIRVSEICPDFFDCQDAKDASWISAGLTILATVASLMLTWVLKKLARPNQVERR